MASKVKVFTIASLALNVAVAGLLVMQKGNYVSQAEEAYQKKTNAYYKQATNIVEGQNSVIENNAVLWNLACSANMQVKNSKEFAILEKRLANPSIFSSKVQGSPDGKGKLRTVSWNSDYYIVASFDKSNKLIGVNVDALLGNADAPALSDEPEEVVETDSDPAEAAE